MKKKGFGEISEKKNGGVLKRISRGIVGKFSDEILEEIVGDSLEQFQQFSKVLVTVEFYI